MRRIAFRSLFVLSVIIFLLANDQVLTVKAAAIVDNGNTQPVISGTQITVHNANTDDYVEPVNTYTDGTLNYYLITQDSSKSSLTSIHYENNDYPLTRVWVGSNLHTMTISGTPIFTYNGPLTNATVFFDNGTYNDSDSQNYFGLSQTNLSLIGLNKTVSGEPAVTITRSAETNSNKYINGTMERYGFQNQNVYLKNLIFDGLGKNMYPTGDKSQGIPKSRGEYFFYFSGGTTGNGSAGFVMKDCILQNVGADNIDSGSNTALYNKNLAMNFYQSYGQHNFENVIIRNIKTKAVITAFPAFNYGFGIISFNETKDNYFKNLKITDDGVYNSISRSIKVENVGTSVVPENKNAVVFAGTLSLPTDSYHNNVYVQSWNYDRVVVPENYRYALYNTTNGVNTYSSAINIYQDILPAITSSQSILDLQDKSWLVQEGQSITTDVQLTTINSVIKAVGSRAPEPNIKISADNNGKINSFTVPDFGSTHAVNIVAVINGGVLFSSKTLVPISADSTITLPFSDANKVTLYNFDFHEYADYTLEEAVDGIDPANTVLKDPNESGSIAGYPVYDTYAPSTIVLPKVLRSTALTFSNCQFTSLANEIVIAKPIAKITVGSSQTLTAQLADSDANSFTGDGFSGTIKNTTDDLTINWFSSNSSIATVDEITGVITGVHAGKVVIYAVAADANNHGEIEKPFTSFQLTVTGGRSYPSGNSSDNSSDEVNSARKAKGLLFIPVTGFTPGVITKLPEQSKAMAYSSMDEMWIEIPNINVESVITGVPQSQGNWDVSWLEKNVGWLNGTAFPTHEGNAVLTGHVNDANGLPGPFASIDQLKFGDQIIIHAWGQQYIYEVREAKSIAPDDSQSLFKHEENSWITLLTCRSYDKKTNSYLERYIVRAVMVKIK